MSDFHEYLSYGAPGLILFAIVKYVLPTIKAITSKASVESRVYEMAHDQLEKMQERYDRLERKYEAEKRERRRLERLLNEIHEK